MSLKSLLNLIIDKINTKDVSWDDLQDKPFGEEVSDIEVIPETVCEEFEEDEWTAGKFSWYGISCSEANFPALYDSDKCNVLWDGVLYENVTLTINPITDTEIEYGVGDRSFENYPFHVYFTSPALSSNWAVNTSDGSTSHTIEVTVVREALKTIDSKYLPTDYIKQLITEVTES